MVMAKVEDLLKLNMKTFANIPLRSLTVDNIKEVVRKDNKQRFSLFEKNRELLICTNEGHSDESFLRIYQFLHALSEFSP
ncbi:hypothetical protein Gogos_020269 [Gossypium gossypioides]|uniref:2'-phosphotransferase n=1 Tax=Gossypium gossypioides TaxID=34282 RepID=A0A7J9D1Q7_GOSGO|nr:hypothetical protein [Gossypium gossypioides]